MHHKIFLFSKKHPRITAAEFSAGDPEHVSELAQMGIQIQTMSDGRMEFFLKKVEISIHIIVFFSLHRYSIGP